MTITIWSLGLFGLILFLIVDRVDHRLNLIGRFPDAMKLNYEKYGILGIVGVIIIAIIIMKYWIKQFYTSSRVLIKR